MPHDVKFKETSEHKKLRAEIEREVRLEMMNTIGCKKCYKIKSYKKMMEKNRYCHL